MVAFIQRMLDLHKQLATATPSSVKVNALNRHIPQLVYELYGLMKKENKELLRTRLKPTRLRKLYTILLQCLFR